MNKFLAGRQAEETAVRYLRSQGYRILGRNIRAKFGEIDVVAREGPTLCFVEVKARSSIRYGWPEESVTWEKRRRLIRLAQGYLQRARWTGPVRFDMVSVLGHPPQRIRLIKGAFEVA